MDLLLDLNVMRNTSSRQGRWYLQAKSVKHAHRVRNVSPQRISMQVRFCIIDQMWAQSSNIKSIAYHINGTAL